MNIVMKSYKKVNCSNTCKKMQQIIVLIIMAWFFTAAMSRLFPGRSGLIVAMRLVSAIVAVLVMLMMMPMMPISAGAS